MSRIEKILRAMIDKTPYVEAPQSRIEEILLAIKNDTEYSKLPQSRIEALLLAIKNNDSYTNALMSRIEEILFAKLKAQEYTKEAQSKIEELLIEWLIYDGIVRYRITLIGGEFVNYYPEGGYSDEQIDANKPFARIKAIDIPPGKKFYYWLRNDNTILSYNEIFSIYVPKKNITITAIYADEDEEIKELVVTYMDTITLLPNENKFQCVTMCNVPDDCTILKAGLIFTGDTITDSDELNSTNYASNVRGSATTAHNVRYKWTKSNVGDGTYYVRSYIKYADANSVEKEAYGYVYKVTINGYEILQ